MAGHNTVNRDCLRSVLTELAEGSVHGSKVVNPGLDVYVSFIKKYGLSDFVRLRSVEMVVS